jgi:hypothetical protein
VTLRQMRLTVFGTTELAHSAVRHVLVGRAATGLGNVIGNKGGLVVKMHVGHTSFAFVSCHLQAHEGATNHHNRNLMCRQARMT